MQEWLDRYTSGDFAGAWLLYTDGGKAAVSQADYVTLNATCPSLQGMQITIVSVQIDGDVAVARVQEGKLVDSYTLAYKHGEWLMEPTDTAFADYAQGVDATIALRKAEGRC